MHLNTVAKYIRRSPYQAVAATLIMIITFFTISLFLLLSVISVKFISYLEKSPQLSIFFKTSTKVEQIMDMKKQIEVTGKASSVKYISKEEGFKIYQQQNKDTARLLDLVTADILPPALQIQANKAEYLGDIYRLVKDSPLIEDNGVIYQKDVIERLIMWVNAIRAVGLGVISVLILESLLIIATIIGIRITMRREEIETMRLIGASNWFIRFPFLLEGMFYGLIGALVGYGLTMGLFFWAKPSLESFFVGVPIFPLDPLLLLNLLSVETATAILLGTFASYIAVLRYLK